MLHENNSLKEYVIAEKTVKAILPLLNETIVQQLSSTDDEKQYKEEK